MASSAARSRSDCGLTHGPTPHRRGFPVCDWTSYEPSPGGAEYVSPGRQSWANAENQTSPRRDGTGTYARTKGAADVDVKMHLALCSVQRRPLFSASKFLADDMQLAIKFHGS